LDKQEIFSKIFLYILRILWEYSRMAKKKSKRHDLKPWQDNEAAFLRRSFNAFGSDLKILARYTGWSVPTLYRKLLEYQIR